MGLVARLAIEPCLLVALVLSLFAQSVEEQIAMAHDVTASRVLDVVLQSPTVPFKEKRKFVMNFIGHYEVLVDDRIGSRVGDNCWAFADTYLKVRRHSMIHLKESKSNRYISKGKDRSFSSQTRTRSSSLVLREILRPTSQYPSSPARP